jgi:hypothetical protein
MAPPIAAPIGTKSARLCEYQRHAVLSQDTQAASPEHNCSEWLSL